MDDVGLTPGQVTDAFRTPAPSLARQCRRRRGEPGISPVVRPSGQPNANDIDYQIEADFIG
jgi:hypothetical protein